MKTEAWLDYVRISVLLCLLASLTHVSSSTTQSPDSEDLATGVSNKDSSLQSNVSDSGQVLEASTITSSFTTIPESNVDDDSTTEITDSFTTLAESNTSGMDQDATTPTPQSFTTSPESVTTDEEGGLTTGMEGTTSAVHVTVGVTTQESDVIPSTAGQDMPGTSSTTRPDTTTSGDARTTPKATTTGTTATETTATETTESTDSSANTAQLSLLPVLLCSTMMAALV